MTELEFSDLIYSIVGIKLKQKDFNRNIYDFGIDSLNFLEIIIELEEKTDKIIDEDKLFYCKTINDIFNLFNN